MQELLNEMGLENNLVPPPAINDRYKLFFSMERLVVKHKATGLQQTPRSIFLSFMTRLTFFFLLCVIERHWLSSPAFSLTGAPPRVNVRWHTIMERMGWMLSTRMAMSMDWGVLQRLLRERRSNVIQKIIRILPVLPHFKKTNFRF